jgi:uncharacterized phage-like protein YoqJ
MKTACFTGHRPNKLGGYTEPNPTSIAVRRALRAKIQQQHFDHQVETFITGMAQGVDLWAGEIVRELAIAFSLKIRLVAALPFIEQPLVWPESAQKRWAKILKGCDEIWLTDSNEQVTVEELRARLQPLWGTRPEVPGFAQKLQARNKWMVDRSQAVIAVWDGTPGGTANCVEYARKKGVHVVTLDPRK